MQDVDFHGLKFMDDVFTRYGIKLYVDYKNAYSGLTAVSPDSWSVGALRLPATVLLFQAIRSYALNNAEV